MSKNSENFKTLDLKIKTPIEIFEEKYGALMQDILDKIATILEQRIDFTKSEIDACININFRWKNPKKDQKVPFLLIPKDLFESFLVNPYFLKILLKMFSQKWWYVNHYIYEEYYDDPHNRKRVYNKNGELIAKTILLAFLPDISNSLYE